MGVDKILFSKRPNIRKLARSLFQDKTFLSIEYQISLTNRYAGQTNHLKKFQKDNFNQKSFEIEKINFS